MEFHLRLNYYRSLVGNSSRLTTPPDVRSFHYDGRSQILTRMYHVLYKRHDYVSLWQDVRSVRLRLLDEAFSRVPHDVSNLRNWCDPAYILYLSWNMEEQIQGILAEDLRYYEGNVLFSLELQLVVWDVVNDDQESRILAESAADIPFLPLPAVQEAIDGLETTKIEHNSNRGVTDCVVCMEELARDVEHTRMPCKHVFHHNCIITWLKTSHFCPLCRFPLPHV